MTEATRTALNALTTFINHDGELNVENLRNELAPDATLRPVALIFAELAARQLDLNEFAQYRTARYFIVKNLADAILDLPAVKQCRFGLNEARKALNREIIARVTTDATRTTRSRLVLK